MCIYMHRYYIYYALHYRCTKGHRAPPIYHMTRTGRPALWVVVGGGSVGRRRERHVIINDLGGSFAKHPRTPLNIRN